MRSLIISLVITALAGLAACSTQSVGDPDPVTRADDIVDRDVPALSAAEIGAYLRNSTLRHEGQSRIWNVYLSEDGFLIGHSETGKGGVERARGQWEVKPEGLICRKWDSDWGGGTNGCAKVFRYDNIYLFVQVNADGSEGAETKRQRLPGNPLKL